MSSRTRSILHPVLIALLAASLGCSSGGGGGSTTSGTSAGSPTGTPTIPTSPTTPAISGDGTLSGVANLTASNQAGAVRVGALAVAAGSLSVQIQTLFGEPIKDVTTGADGSFGCDGLPVGETLRVAIKTGGATMFTFVEIPRDAKASAGVRVDPLATLIFHRIVRIFRERGLHPGDLGSVDCAALAAAVRRAVDGLRDDLAFRVEVGLEQLSEDPRLDAALFERLVPREVLEAAGDALGRAEADADIESGASNLTVAVARRLVHTRAAVVISMQPGSSELAVIEWVRSLRPELRFDPAKADGTRWSGSGPCLVKIPFLEPDRNGTEDQPPPFLDGPVFDEAKIGALAEAMQRGKTLTLPELHKVFFAAPDAGAGFVMIGFGQFGDQPAPYVLSGDARAKLVPPPQPGQPPDWRAAGAVAPPFALTFGPYLGRVPSLEELRQKFFDKRIHIPGNPTGAPHAFVAARSDLFWTSRGAQADPIRVDLELTRHPEGSITAARVTEAVAGAFFLGLTERTQGPEGELVFLDARTLRPLRTTHGKPLVGVRRAFADLDRGAVELGDLHQRYSRTEDNVFGGPPVPIGGRPVPVIHDAPDGGGRPVLVEGPVLSVDGTWSTSAPFAPPSDPAKPKFFLGLNETMFPYNASTSAPFLIDARSGAPLPGPNGPIRVLLSRIEAELAKPLHRSTTRLPSCAVPNPRHDPRLDPFFDDVNDDGAHGAGEPSFGFRPFVPPDVLANFDAAQGSPNYLAGPRAYGLDPVIYSLPDGRPFSPGEPPPGFRTDRSPKDNGLRLRRFRARLNGFLHRRPHFVFAQLLAAFPPAFFDGEHTITPETRLDVLQALALARVRLETPEVVPDVTLDVDPGPGEQLQRVPFLGFEFAPGAPDPRLMDRLTGGLTR
jgi:hypothetical protein